MAEPAELARLAAATAILRPDWPERSIRTYLQTNHTHRGYAELAIALTACAADPASRAPKRLEETDAARWWRAALTATSQPEAATPQPTRFIEGVDDRPPQPDQVAHRGGTACRDLLGDHDHAEAGSRERRLAKLIKDIRALVPGLSAAQRDRLTKAAYAVNEDTT
ncbi:MAG: hypothetical protein ACRDMV_01125 [Streptosporangiales bacterium]